MSLLREWLSLPAVAPPPRETTPKAQLVQESEALSPDGQHRVVTLERTSPGGTRHVAQFKQAATGAMSPAERGQKRRAKASLFPEQQAATRMDDAERKRKAYAAERAAELQHRRHLLQHKAARHRETHPWREFPDPESTEVAEHVRQLRRVLAGAKDEAASMAEQIERGIHDIPWCGCCDPEEDEPCPCFFCNQNDSAWSPSDLRESRKETARDAIAWIRWDALQGQRSEQERKQEREEWLDGTHPENCTCGECHDIDDDKAWERAAQRLMQRDCPRPPTYEEIMRVKADMRSSQV
jgi:hypothetical protein